MSPDATDADRFFREFEGDPEFERERALLRARTNLAINLLRLRGQRGVTQTELAVRAGMRQPRIAEIESGDYNPRLDTVAKLAWALGVGPDELLVERGITPAEVFDRRAAEAGDTDEGRRNPASSVAPVCATWSDATGPVRGRVPHR